MMGASTAEASDWKQVGDGAPPPMSFDSARSSPAAPRFGLPVVCQIGKVCFVQNYFDHDPGPGFRDFNCGVLGYDGHRGTDIRLTNYVVMARGVPVVAAAPGRLRHVRDGEPDVDAREIGLEALKGREPGNVVLIDHGHGWLTHYGHLRRGSVTVEQGQKVVAGQRLGLIGLSGKTEFPHVEFGVRYRGRPVDPFIGLGDRKRCGLGTGAMWNAEAQAALSYVPSGVLNAGFADVRPSSFGARRGAYERSTIARGAAALVFWIDLFGMQMGDRERVRIIGPNGVVLIERANRMPARKAQWFRIIGKRRRDTPWPSGTYRGEYHLLRTIDGELRTVISVTRDVIVK